MFGSRYPWFGLAHKCEDRDHSFLADYSVTEGVCIDSTVYRFHENLEASTFENLSA